MTDLVSEQTGFEPDDVECPDDVEAEVGERFQCTFTGPEGPYVADMEIEQVEGDEVVFQIQTHPE